eukprot:TRINITY_DN3061_c0_g1_i2.p1 TRINITY_DN3061_c0_g1~~TRINITY_DN3061_c0_g1_i2.p1  ORF type:complete len:412 (+),score=82.19 TRINITY_DN3061_c0_g1_i2:134-1369(+)
MYWLWVYLLIAIAVFIVIIIPFATFFYESDDGIGGEYHHNQLFSAIKWTFVVLFVFAIAAYMSFVLYNKVEIDYDFVARELVPIGDGFDFKAPCTGEFCDSGTGNLTYEVQFQIYLIAVLGIFGWFLFVLFGGIGLFALPMDMINQFRQRPIPIDHKKYQSQKTSIASRCDRLFEAGEKIQRNLPAKISSRTRKQKKQINRFKKNVYELESEFKRCEAAFKAGGGNPLFYFLMALGGVLGFLISILWLVHIVLFMFFDPPKSDFLNTMFIELNETMGFLGTTAYGVFAFWLFLCVIKGNTKFGLNFLIFAVHPMRLGDTMMSAFLFNLFLILLSSIAVTQFCVKAFSIFARLTAAELIFTVQIGNLKGFDYFWQYYLYAFFGFSILSFFWSLWCPTNFEKRRKNRMEDDLD